MAGPVTMTLGGVGFEALGFSYTDRRGQLATRWAEISVAGGFNPQQWLGPQNETVTIRGVLFPAEFGGTGALAALKFFAEAGQVLPFFTLDGAYFGMWTIQRVGDDASFIDAAGQPRRVAYRITIKRYVSPGGFGFTPASVLGFI